MKLNRYEKEDFNYNPIMGEKINTDSILKYVGEPEPFSKTNFITEYEPEHLIYMREHKNRMVNIRDKYSRDSVLYSIYDAEIKRTIVFLQRFI